MDLIAICLLIVLYVIKHHGNKRVYLLLSLVSYYIFLIAFLGNLQGDHHFVPIFIPLLLVISEVIYRVCRARPIAMVGVVITTAVVFSGGFQYARRHAHFENKQDVWNGGRAILEDLNNNTVEKTIGDKFSIVMLTNAPGATRDEPLFWVALEDITGKTFTKVVDVDNNFQSINGDTYIYLICRWYENEKKACQDEFLLDYPNYVQKGVIYSSQTYTIERYDKVLSVSNRSEFVYRQ